MRTVNLAGLGLTVSVQGLGCMGMSQSYGPGDDDESRATLNRALDLGVTLFDTADVYGTTGSAASAPTKRSSATPWPAGATSSCSRPSSVSKVILPGPAVRFQLAPHPTTSARPATRPCAGCGPTTSTCTTCTAPTRDVPD